MNFQNYRYPAFVILIMLLLVACQTNQKELSIPNIIIILADDLGFGDISINFEANKIKTPHIDRIAKEGIRFSDAHSSSSVCTPTRYSLLTGRYNWRTRLKSGVLTGKSKALIPNTRSTIASILQKQGYHTAFIGKWHLGWDWARKDVDVETGEGWDETDFVDLDFTKSVTNTPNDLGFDYFYGHSGSLDMAPYVYVENGQVTAVPDTVTVNTGKYSWWRKGPTSSDFNHEDVTPNFFRRSMDYIRQKSNDKNPFFLYLALPSPHTPILPGQEWRGKSGLNPYGDFVMMIDDYMGKMLSLLEDQGIKGQTLVIFTSDNGCSPAAKIDELKAKGHAPSGVFRGHKADIYEGGHRVPFVAQWPDVIQSGSISEETICHTDLMATCADIVDYPLEDNEGEDSYSLMPILRSKPLQSPIREATVHHSINGSFAIRKGQWKLIMCPSSGGWSYPRPNNKEVIDSLPKIQLYDLLNDPAESNNLQALETEKVEELKVLLNRYIFEGRSTKGNQQQNDPIDFDWKQVSFMNE